MIDEADETALAAMQRSTLRTLSPSTWLVLVGALSACAAGDADYRIAAATEPAIEDDTGSPGFPDVAGDEVSSDGGSDTGEEDCDSYNGIYYTVPKP
ncbi:MAG: hypothetical protein IAG13_16325 [Deltaproteobacteria bacterium]|nr:hypothetical protein [Nannocystaceae bacterium]